MSLSNVVFDVVSNGTSGICANIESPKPVFFCDQQIRKNNPIFLPPDSNVTTAFETDQQIAAEVSQLESCRAEQKVINCTVAFAPCEILDPPTRKKFCKSDCIDLTKCSGYYREECFEYPYAGTYCDKHNKNPFCETSPLVADNTQDTSVVCTSSAPPRFSRFVIYGAIALPIITQLAAVLTGFKT